MVQWLRLHTSTIGDMDSIPGWGTKIPYVMGYGQKTNKTKRRHLIILLPTEVICIFIHPCIHLLIQQTFTEYPLYYQAL